LVYKYRGKMQSEGNEEKRRTLEKLRKKNREENFRKRETHLNICRNVECEPPIVYIKTIIFFNHYPHNQNTKYKEGCYRYSFSNPYSFIG